MVQGSVGKSEQDRPFHRQPTEIMSGFSQTRILTLRQLQLPPSLRLLQLLLSLPPYVYSNCCCHSLLTTTPVIAVTPSLRLFQLLPSLPPYVYSICCCHSLLTSTPFVAVTPSLRLLHLLLSLPPYVYSICCCHSLLTSTPFVAVTPSLRLLHLLLSLPPYVYSICCCLALLTSTPFVAVSPSLRATYFQKWFTFKHRVVLKCRMVTGVLTYALYIRQQQIRGDHTTHFTIDHDFPFNVKAYRSRHALDKPFVCGIDGCDKSYYQRTNLQRHKKDKHSVVIG